MTDAEQTPTTGLMAHPPGFGRPLTHTEMLAGMIAEKIFPHVLDRTRQAELRQLLMSFAGEIKRSAIEL